MAEDSSDSTNRLAIIIANLKLGIDVNPFQPINKINKFLNKKLL